MTAPAEESTSRPPEFSLVVSAGAGDIDELGHVSNIVYVRWIQEVAKAHSHALGWGHDAYRRLGAVFVVRRHEIDYLAPVLAGDGIRLTTWIERWSAATCVRATRLERADDGRLVAKSATTWALVALESGRPRRVPQEIHASFARPVALSP